MYSPPQTGTRTDLTVEVEIHTEDVPRSWPASSQKLKEIAVETAKCAGLSLVHQFFQDGWPDYAKMFRSLCSHTSMPFNSHWYCILPKPHCSPSFSPSSCRDHKPVIKVSLKSGTLPQNPSGGRPSTSMFKRHGAHVFSVRRINHQNTTSH